MRYETIKSPESVDDDVWRVEAIDYQGEGEIYVATFSGPGAEQRATEYAAWQNSARATNESEPRT